MKYLVVFVVVVLGYVWWRGQRTKAPPPQGKRSPLPAPQDMVACARCGVHLPRSEALTHGSRTYCCAEHQRQDAH